MTRLPAQMTRTHAVNDQSSHGNGDWDMIEEGAAYRLALNYNAGQSSDFNWQLVAVDRVGNASYSDADVNKISVPAVHVLTIDNDPPIIVRARTGVSYDDKSFKKGLGKDTRRSTTAPSSRWRSRTTARPARRTQVGSGIHRLHPLPAGCGRGR